MCVELELSVFTIVILILVFAYWGKRIWCVLLFLNMAKLLHAILRQRHNDASK